MTQSRCPSEFRLTRAGVMTVFGITDETVATLEHQGFIRFDSDEQIDVRDVALAFVNQAIEIAQNARRSVIQTVSTLVDCSVIVRDSIAPLPNNAMGAKAMRSMMNDYSQIMQSMRDDLVESVGRKLQ
jgi:hypothetical protein